MKHSLIWVFAVCKCSLLGIICENIHSLHLKRKKKWVVYAVSCADPGIFVRRECVCVEGGVFQVRYKKALATFFFLFNLIILVLNWYYLIIEVQWLISKKKYYHFPRFQSGTNISRGSNFLGEGPITETHIACDFPGIPLPPPPPGSVHAHIGFWIFDLAATFCTSLWINRLQKNTEK